MYIFQFLADTFGPTPVVFDLAEAVSDTAVSARASYEAIGNMPGQWDHLGKDQAPFDLTEISLVGQIYLRKGGTRESAERMMKRLTGQKGWLIGYRFEQCCCDVCGENECMCGNGLSQGFHPAWYATYARLVKVQMPDNASKPYIYGLTETPSPTASFVQERPWERITPDHWLYGDQRIPNQIARSLKYVYTLDHLFTERHWPMRMGQPPAHGYWWRKPLEWLEDAPWLYENCVGHWSSGGWQRGYIGTIVYVGAVAPTTINAEYRVQKPPGVLSIYNGGDWPALCRLGFTNFSWVRLVFKSEGVVVAHILMNRSVSSPQYLYVNTANGEISVRYCPVSSSPCLDLSELASFVPEASTATPAAAIVHGNLINSIRPGITQIEVSGFRMPGLKFHWAYDLTPLYS